MVIFEFDATMAIDPSGAVVIPLNAKFIDVASYTIVRVT